MGTCSLGCLAQPEPPALVKRQVLEHNLDATPRDGIRRRETLSRQPVANCFLELRECPCHPVQREVVCNRKNSVGNSLAITSNGRLRMYLQLDAALFAAPAFSPMAQPSMLSTGEPLDPPT